MPRGGRKGTHRSYYPHAKKGEDPRTVKPTIKADSVITSDRVEIDVLENHRRYTPRELKSMASWLYALAHEAEEAATSGFISAAKSYDVTKEKVISVE